jgi:hypothetical protein
MRLVNLILFWTGWFVLGIVLAVAQQPIGMGPGLPGNSALGSVRFFNWYSATPTGGCRDGASGYCVGGNNVGGDTYYWTAWLPNASGLPVKNGLPIVGTINDFTFGTICGGNVALLQLDTFNWSSPAASHITKINCLPSFGVQGGLPMLPPDGTGTSPRQIA